MSKLMVGAGRAALLLLLCLTVSKTAEAQISIKPIQGCAIPKLDGEKVPFPLKTANSKFELAEDETYLLNGYIVQQEGKPYFKIDFLSQPWLATPKRSQFPYFPVDIEDPKVLVSKPNELIQMAVVVRRSPAPSQGQELQSDLHLQVILPPTSLQSMRSMSVDWHGSER